MTGVRRRGIPTSSTTTTAIHSWFGSGGDKNLDCLTGPCPAEAGTGVLTGLRDELAGDAATRPHRAVVEEVLGLHAVALALQQALEGH